MKLNDAIQLISHQQFSVKNRQSWADLGSGTGTFTSALASILEPGSQILAVDTDRSALNKIPENFNRVSISKQSVDFVNGELHAANLNGILMANSLHFVKEQAALLNKLRHCMAKDSCFLIIEYNSNSPSPWVPYPLSFDALKSLFYKAGYKHIYRLNSRPSIYGNREIYSALIE